MRVYEIAKEVGIPNKDLIAKIRALGLEVNNHMSSLDADDVARIKRSLEKEKGTAAPQQTQKLSSGTVLRRRSSGDKAAHDDDDAPAPSPSSRAAHAPAPAAAAPPPVIRRRVEAAPEPETKPVARAEAPAPAPVKAPVVRAEPKIEAPKVEARPAPQPAATQPPSRPTPVPAEAKPAPAPVAPPPIVTPTPPAPAVVVAAAPETPVVVPSRSRVIVAGPQVVARTSAEAGSTHGGQRVVDVQPPPSTPLPPRITPVRPAAGTQQHAAPAQGIEAREQREPMDARTQFERDLERARARTADKPSTRSVEVDMTQPRSNGSNGGNGEEAQAATPTRDPSRPAVGSVIALPPRIKITERTPISGRPAPGPQPPNPIRGRFAQQQQRGGRPGGPHGGHGRHDMKKLPLGKKGKQTTITTPAEHKRVVRIEDTIAISELARSMGIKAPEVLKKLWGMGMTGVNINASIDFDTAQLLASEFGYEVQNVAFKEEEAFTQKS
ncbi:MAG TPA: translation initiation factor IF-2 N-terminal domain-containing protein, partial [Kofleriaceae bacterium]|nr:translation initiation factor IF-2 N-terminal domain-containing protein [Kofleriaceae bacterium]